MNPKISPIQELSDAKSWRFSLPLLIALAILCWGPPMRAAQTDTWTGASGGSGASGLNAWKTAGNWSGSVAPSTAGDIIIFPASATYYYASNNYSGLTIQQMTFNGSGYILAGQALTITNGITDTAGANTNGIALTLGASQTFANNSGNVHIENGAIALGTNVLTVSGFAPVYLNGALSSPNGGQLIVNNSSAARLSGADAFGTNDVEITSTFSPSSVTTNITIYTNAYVVAGVSTNYTYFTNIVIATNGTYVYTTNVFGPLNADAVVVNGGDTLQLGNASALPSGAKVGSLSLNGTLDLNGQSPTVNGLEDSGASGGVVDNLNAGATGLYTLTVGNANSNSVFTGVIGNGSFAPGGATYGTIGLTKTGYGTLTLNSPNQYGGPTIINQGTLALGTSGSLGTFSTQVSIGSGAVLDVSAVSGGFGYVPSGALTVAAGTPTKPYTNFWGSYDPNVSPNYTVTITGTNNVLTYQTNTDLATYTNVVVMTNFVSYSYATNTIISVVDADVKGNFTINGGGAISPITAISPNIATWKIDGDLTIDESYTLERNRINFLLNDTTTPGGGTNTLVAVTGNLTLGDELDFVITPVAGTLAAGDYILMTSSGYTPETGGDVPVFKLVEQRGLVGDTVTAVGNNIVLHSLGGTATPGNLVWAGTPAQNNWDVHLTQNWLNNSSPDFFYALDNVTFNDNGVGTIVLPNPVNPSSVTFDNDRTNYTFAQNASTYLTGAKGGLIVNGPGTVTLQNPNKLEGDVTVNGGTLHLGYYDSTTSGQDVLYSGVPAHDLILSGGTIIQDSGNNVVPRESFENLHVNPGASTMAQAVRGSSEYANWNISNTVTRAVGSVWNYDNGGNVKAGYHMGLYFYGTNSPDGTNDYGSNGILGGWATFNLNDWFYANNNNTTTTGGNMAYPYYQTDNNPANWGAASNVQVSGSASGIGTQTINSLKIETGSDIDLGINSGQTLTISSGGILVPTASAPRLDAITGSTLMGAPNQDLIVLNNNIISGSSLTIGSVIADNGGASGLTTAGGGTTILTGNNTYTGPTYINNGFEGAAAGTLQVGDNGTSGDISQSSAVIDNGTLAFSRSDNVTVNGAINGTGNLEQGGTGVLTLTGSNTVSGQVTISAGTLQLGNGGAHGSVNNASGIVDNGTLVFNNSSTASAAAVISGTGNLIQFGSGNVVLSAAETYLGNTIVSNGTVTLTASGSLPNTAAIVVKSGALLDASAVSGGLTLRNAAPAEQLQGSGTVNGSVTTAVGTSLIPGTDGSFGTLSINNNLDLEGGSFVFDVTGTNFNAGGDLINVGGTLTLGAGTMFIHVVGNPLTPGVYPLFHVASGTINGNVANLGIFGLGTQHVSLQVDSVNHNLDLLVSATSITALTWVGDGSQNIWNTTVANWTTGSGSVAYGNPEIVTFSDSGSVTPPVDITVNVSPTAVTNSSTKDYVLGSNSGSAGRIIGGASLVKTGSGKLTLQTVNTYLGTTTITNGTVQLGNNTAAAEDGMVGSGQVTIGAGASLVADNAASEQLSGPLNGSGFLTQQGSGTLVLAGDNSAFSGPITISTNSSTANVFLQMGNGASGTLGTGTVANNATLLFDVGPKPTSQVSVNADITGTGGITNLGPGIVTLAGNNNFAGNLANDTGTIQLGSDNALPSGTPVYMDDSAGGSVGTLDLNDHDNTIASLQGATTGIGTSSFMPANILNNGSGTATLTIGGGANTRFSGQLLDNNNSGSGKLALVVNNNTTLILASGYNNVGNISPNLFSGGLTISNAMVVLGYDNGSSTPAGEGSASAGLGTITLEGGLGADTNGLTGLPTNGVLLACGTTITGGTSTTPTLNTQIGEVNVPAGQFGSIIGSARGQFSCTLTGGGTLTFQPTYARSRVGGDWTAFTGTIIFQVVGAPPNAGGGLGDDSNLGYPNATVFMGLNNVQQIQISGTQTSGNNVFPIGALAGGDSTSTLGGGTINSGTKNGSRNTIWAIGNLGLTTTNGSQFTDGGCGVRVVGGSLTLTNDTLSFGGQLVVSNATLAFAPLGVTTNVVGDTTNYVAINYLTNTTYLVGTNITIAAGGVLDLSQAGDNTLHLDSRVRAQTLFGNGTVNGNLLVTNSIVAPGRRANDTGVYPGQLTVTGSAEIDTGTTFQMAVSLSGYDSITAGGGLTINAAALVVVTNGPAFANGTSNVFRFFPTAVIGITNIIVPDVPYSYWVTNLTLDGSMALVNTNSAVGPNPNPPPVQVTVSGNTLTLGWPTNLGWVLQSQTNDSSVGLSTNWVDVAGTDTRTNEVITIDPNSPAVFYRLKKP
jgi:fibronectin-binding autotransporter adhesin